MKDCRSATYVEEELAAGLARLRRLGLLALREAVDDGLL